MVSTWLRARSLQLSRVFDYAFDRNSCFLREEIELCHPFPNVTRLLFEKPVGLIVDGMAHEKLPIKTGLSARLRRG